MVEPLGPRPMGPYSGIQKVNPTKDRESKKKRQDHNVRRDADDDPEEEALRKGRQIDDHA